MSEQEYLDDLLNCCLSEINNESDEQTDKKIKEHKNIVKNNINNINIDNKPNNTLSTGQKVEPSVVVHESASENKPTQTPGIEGQIHWDDDVIKLFNEKFPGKDIYNMSLDELKHLRDDVEALREEFSLIELANKVLSNGAYGASANAKGFYFYNLSVAGDITAECRALTKYFWNNLENFFHEDIWQRKDLWKQFGFELDEKKHQLCRELHVSCYSDTDSVHGGSEVYIKEINADGSVSYTTMTISNLYNYIIENYNIQEHTNENSQQMIAVPQNIEVFNWSENNGLYFVPMRFLMKHTVNKPLYKIVTETGKSIITTNDHSIMAKRYNKDNKLDNSSIIAIKAKDIDIETDKLICVDCA